MISGSLCSLVHAATHTSQSSHTQIPYYHFATHTSHAHKPHPLITPPSTAASRHACGRPRRGAVAAVLPHWDDDDDRLPGGRLTRALPPRANGHDRGAWCERRKRAASARWAPRLPGQPASGLHPHALVRAAVDHFDRDRRGLWVRHAGTRAQSNTHAARGLTVRRSPSIGANTSWCHSARDLVFARLAAGVTSV